jgi:hypothetical protein
MQSRHVKLLGIFAMMLCMFLGAAHYLYVVFHYGHVWSLCLVIFFLVCMLCAPAVCFGYNATPFEMQSMESSMSSADYGNWRDTGYIVGVCFYLLTYAPTFAAFYGSWGSRPPVWGVIDVYTGNFYMGLAFVAWLRIFVFTHSLQAFSG